MSTPRSGSALPPLEVAGAERPAWGRVIAQSPVAALIVELDELGAPGRVRAANPAAASLLAGAGDAGDRQTTDLVGVWLSALLPQAALSQLLDSGGAAVIALPADGLGSSRWLAASLTRLEDPDTHAMPRALLHLHDLTAQWSSRQDLDRAARADPLTGLLNRAELLRQLASVDPAVDGPQVAVIFLDLDGFKLVNDTRGHHVGDELLVAVARRIAGVLRPGERFARLGGDEFVIVCPHLADARAARVVAERVRATLDRPLVLGELTHRLSMSVGVALADVGRIDAADLLRAADMAMYRAKDSGGNTVRLHSTDMDLELAAGEQIRASLMLVLAPGGSAVAGHGAPALVMHFQPVVEIGTGRLAYVEALSRLRDTTGTLLHPARFLTIAARSGLTSALSAQVLTAALRQRAIWQQQGVDVPVGINLSPGQVGSTAFAETALRIIDEHGATAQGVVLEMSEFGHLEATGPARLATRRLRAAGIGLAIDHFGMGHSSLGALRLLGPHRVKIDRAFVAGIQDSAADRAIVTAAVSVAHALGQRVVAEGVETPEQLAVLAGLGCDEAQGYLISQVLPADQLSLDTLRWSARTLVPATVTTRG